jgi:hypothetical protein
VLWRAWRALGKTLAPGALHEDKANTIRFVSRPISREMTAEVAFSDLKGILEFLLSCDTALADAVGVDLGPGEETGSRE